MPDFLDIVQFHEHPIGGFSNVRGNYDCICNNCGIVFTGDKRAWQCYPCAVCSISAKIENDFGSGI